MALEFANITFDLSDQLGVDFDPRRTKVWITTNVPNDTVIDQTGNKIRLGSGNVTVNPDGTGQIDVWKVGQTGLNPLSWQTTVHVDYPDRNERGGRGRRDFGPFTIASSGDLAVLVAEQEVPPTYVSQVTAQLDAKVTEASGYADDAAASAAQAKSVAEIDTSDALVTNLFTTPGTDLNTAATATFAAKSGSTYTGTHDFSGASLVGVGGGGSGAASTTTALMPLHVPTYDRNPAITHPDVLRIPGGWNGYEYWMAYTPYPAAARENPSIARSKDGISWETPTGLTNPIATPATAVAMGYDYWADTDLVLSADGTTLMCYFKGTKNGVTNEYVMSSSTDGVTWTAPTVVVPNASNPQVSPAVVREAGGSFTMFEVKDSTIARRTSADGVTWSAATQGTIPALPAPYSIWHVDVCLTGGKYHALVMATTANSTTNPFRLFYWTSTNGTTWTGSTSPAVPLTGTRMDVKGHYRSTIQPAASGASGKFDIWVAGMDNHGTGTSGHTFAVHRVGIIRDIDLANPPASWAFPDTPSGYVSDLGSGDQVWVTASDIRSISGSGAAGLLHNWPTFVLPESPSGTHIATVTLPPVPRDWSEFVVEALLANPGATTGNVSLRTNVQFADPSTALIDGSYAAAVNTAVAAQDVPFWATLTTAPIIAMFNNNPVLKTGCPVRVAFQRSTSSAGGDTFADAVHILAVRLRRTD